MHLKIIPNDLNGAEQITAIAKINFVILPDALGLRPVIVWSLASINLLTPGKWLYFLPDTVPSECDVV